MLSSSSLRARTGDLAAAVERFSELLDHFGAGGDPGHLVTSLRNLVTLQVRLGQYRPAAALYGGVAEHPSSPSYGEEAQRLVAAAEECRDALGDTEFARVVAVGRARTLDATVDAAAAALRAARARRRRPDRRHRSPLVSAPMTAVATNGISIEYDIHGDDDAPPLLLVMGLGGQLVQWTLPFVEQLVDRGSG